MHRVSKVAGASCAFSAAAAIVQFYIAIWIAGPNDRLAGSAALTLVVAFFLFLTMAFVEMGRAVD